MTGYVSQFDCNQVNMQGATNIQHREHVLRTFCPQSYTGAWLHSLRCIDHKAQGQSAPHKSNGCDNKKISTLHSVALEEGQTLNYLCSIAQRLREKKLREKLTARISSDEIQINSTLILRIAFNKKTARLFLCVSITCRSRFTNVQNQRHHNILCAFFKVCFSAVNVSYSVQGADSDVDRMAIHRVNRRFSKQNPNVTGRCMIVYACTINWNLAR